MPRPNTLYQTLREWLKQRAIARQKRRIGHHLHQIELASYRLTRLQGSECVPIIREGMANGERYTVLSPGAFRHPLH